MVSLVNESSLDGIFRSEELLLLLLWLSAISLQLMAGWRVQGDKRKLLASCSLHRYDLTQRQLLLIILLFISQMYYFPFWGTLRKAQMQKKLNAIKQTF